MQRCWDCGAELRFYDEYDGQFWYCPRCRKDELENESEEDNEQGSDEARNEGDAGAAN